MMTYFPASPVSAHAPSKNEFNKLQLEAMFWLLGFKKWETWGGP